MEDDFVKVNSSEKLKVVILGGSNSIKKNGLYKSIRDRCNVTNLALGASTSNQNLYQLIRHEDEIRNADLIISESNVNDFHNINLVGTDKDFIKDRINHLYSYLSSLSTKVTIILLPLQTKSFKESDFVNQIHREFLAYYQLDYIDVDRYYKEHGLEEFFNYQNLDHPLDGQMYELGNQIIDNIAIYSDVSNNISLPKYEVISELAEGHIKKNSLVNERVNVISKEVKVKVNQDCELVGLHSWNDFSSEILILSGQKRYVRGANNECQFHDVNNMTIKDLELILSPNINGENITDKSIRYNRESEVSSQFNIISLFILLDDYIKILNLNRQGKSHENLLKFISDDMSLIKQHLTYKRAKNPIYKFFSNNRNNIFIRYIYSLKAWFDEFKA
jgi:hypothetical protein